MILLIIALIGGLVYFNPEIVETTFVVVLKSIAWILDIILTPVNMLLEQFLPDFSEYGVLVDNMLVIAGQYLGWILDATFIPELSWTMIISYMIMSFTVTAGLWVIKLAIQWKQALQ